MANGKLGTPARILYESKNKTTGLTDIVATIEKPNGDVVGPFPLVEYATGFYRFNFITALSDPEGDYLGLISSPTEGHTTNFKLALFSIEGGGSGGAVIENCDPVIGQVGNLKLIGQVKELKNVIGSVSKISAIGSVKEIENIKGKINKTSLIGVTNKEC